MSHRVFYLCEWLIALNLLVFSLPGDSLGQDKSSDSVREARLQILNASEQAIVILRKDGERWNEVAEIEAGRNKTIRTHVGQVHHLRVADQKPLLRIPCRQPIQAFRFERLQQIDLVSQEHSFPDNQVIEVTDQMNVPDFYDRIIFANGYPIVGSAGVKDHALREAAYLINQLLSQRPDVRTAMISSGSRMCVMSEDEFTTDLPEFRWLGRRSPEPGIDGRDFWDARARGLGGSETDPYCSCGEENLLNFPGDPYSTENILIHEFAHNIHLRGMNNIDDSFDSRLKETYNQAMAAGLWKGKYASVNHHEYFAEGVQSWFNNNRQNDHDHNHVDTRQELWEYDPGLAAMCKEVFGETEFRYVKTGQRLKDHLADYQPDPELVFRWPNRLSAAKKQILEQAQKRDKEANQ